MVCNVNIYPRTYCPGAGIIGNNAMKSKAVCGIGAPGRSETPLIFLAFLPRTAKNHHRKHYGNPRGPRT